MVIVTFNILVGGGSIMFNDVITVGNGLIGDKAIGEVYIKKERLRELMIHCEMILEHPDSTWPVEHMSEIFHQFASLYFDGQFCKRL